MKYAIWFVRLVFAAWMIPAGINHFVPIFPQPMGNQPLSMEMIRALIDSGLFDLVKAVELIAGVGVLLGFYTPLMLLICLPVSFNVFYWDAPLEGWGSGASRYGYATLFCNLVLCLAWFKDYRQQFALRAMVEKHKQLVVIGRLLFGAWMLLAGANYLFLSLWPVPTSTDALATQLMDALVHSRLLDVAMVLQLIGGALLLAGLYTPAVLSLLMPLTTCALYWALVLDQQPLNLLLGVAAFALNGLLMLAHLPYYSDCLKRYTRSAGETAGESGSFDALLVNPTGRTAQAPYLTAMACVLLATGFFAYFVPGRTSQFCMLMLVYPTFVLLARRLRDMGMAAALVLLPLALTLIAYAIKLAYLSLGASFDGMATWIALAVTAVFVVWGSVGGSKEAKAATN